MLQQIGDFFGNIKLHQVGVGSHKRLLESFGLDDAGNLLNRALAAVRDAVRNPSG